MFARGRFALLVVSTLLFVSLDAALAQPIAPPGPLGPPTAEPIVVTPASLDLAIGEAARAVVHAPGDGAFGIVHSGCGGIAVPETTGGGLTLHGLTPGHCSVTLTGSGGVTTLVPVVVTESVAPAATASAQSPVVVRPPSAILARGTSVTLRVSQGTYAGPFSLAGDCNGVVRFGGLGRAIGVIAIDPGTCNALVVGLGGRKAKLSITVQPSPEIRP
jgi:hypothetical protein